MKHVYMTKRKHPDDGLSYNDRLLLELKKNKSYTQAEITAFETRRKTNTYSHKLIF